MGGFVTFYNYITFRLLGPGFDLSQTQVALIFLAYAFGVITSYSIHYMKLYDVRKGQKSLGEAASSRLVP